MTFRDSRLSADIEQNATFKYAFSTAIRTVNSGFEQRKINWSQFRLTADISYPIQKKETLQEIINHFIVMNGSAYSFPMKNWDMFRIGDPRTGDVQLIGTGTGSQTNFQLNKLSEVGIYNFTKEVTKPRAGGKVYLNSTLQTITTDYTIDLLTGIISFVSAPGPGVQVNYCGEFDFPMRYASDDLNVLATMYLENYEIASIPSIQLIEVRGE